MCVCVNIGAMPQLVKVFLGLFPPLIRSRPISLSLSRHRNVDYRAYSYSEAVWLLLLPSAHAGKLIRLRDEILANSAVY